ncbi:zinc finger MYM-type protein 1 [Trichonephila clavipes]|uniref:Zinc finger MYM-type protein 1 n=1 Tax=Trichonephila clavipes TaxID=2585209 RepID=A0A8X6SHF8_TRICX|nr:zinc finger MYM-type protein 1 [Trichonephila clavipes]
MKHLKTSGLLQQIYVFFSASTHKWELLNCEIKLKFTLNSLSQTKWSCLYDAVEALKDNYDIVSPGPPKVTVQPWMKVYEGFESKVTVRFTKTHVGLGVDVERMKITRGEKEDIARKLENKIPVEAILDDIRNSMNQKLERIHLITRQDMKNITRGVQYKL